mgnify:CR=1 FL=1
MVDASNLLLTLNPDKERIGISQHSKRDIKMLNIIRKYLRDVYDAHARLVSNTVRKIEFILPPKNACELRNLRNSLNSHKFRFGYDSKKRLYYIFEDGFLQYFSSRERGFRIYKDGLAVRVNSLAKTYLLEQLNIDSNDIVIDCGANYGDLYHVLRSTIKQENYITFEPGPDEYRCLMLNVAHAIHYNKGLGEVDGLSTLWLNSYQADSSFIEPANWDEKVQANVITLDTFMAHKEFKKVKLLKLEAEGFEPEILKGAEQFIEICEYVAVDGGYERGKQREQTLGPQLNFLLKRNFEIIDMYLPWGRALLRNNRFNLVVQR